MQTILGPFHPQLENALLAEIHERKAADPFHPLLIVVPSDSLCRHLKILLTRGGDSYVNLLLLTFHQLNSRLLAEKDAIRLPVLHDDLFFEEVLRHTLRTKQSGTEAFEGIDERVGGCVALWQTLRDLKDAMVDPELVLEALHEAHLGRQTAIRIRNLLNLFQNLLNVCHHGGIEGYAEWQKRAIELVSSSLFLKQFTHIFFYGFYDLTQIQLEFFYAVTQNLPTSLFFPLFHATPRHEGWNFAERFFQRYIQGRPSHNAPIINLLDDPSRPKEVSPAMRLFDTCAERRTAQSPKPWGCKIFSTFGAHDEIATVTKEILNLVTHEGRTFEEIGVVARTLDPYRSIIKDVFRRHGIPLADPLEEPVLQFPLAKSVLLLVNLPAKDFLRAHVIDLVSSPYFRLSPCAGSDSPVRPDLWDLASRELGICKGIQEWRRLEDYSERNLVLSRIHQDDEPSNLIIAAAHIRQLADVFNTLRHDLTALPQQAPWSEYVKAWQGLLRKYLGIGAAPDSDMPTLDERVGSEILAVLDRMTSLDAVEADVALSYFCHTLKYWLERSHITLRSDRTNGVAVLNGTAARGLSFPILFLIGLNEGVFPRTITEDAFLRDREREIFERDLGFKVNLKLGGFDEEKLIFTLLAGAAQEQLYCLYQRADESGRALSPSWYLNELKRAIADDGGAPVLESTIPRSITDKAGVHPFTAEDLLLPEELAVRLGLQGRDATSLLDGFGLLPNVFQQGRQVVERLDLSSSRLNAFDGVVQPLVEFWDRLSERGLSPTALEVYGRCPFQFFARYVLGLERLQRPEEIQGPSPADFGELGHAILKTFYQHVMDQGDFTIDPSGLDWESMLTGAARQAFDHYESTNPVGYRLAWESLQESLTQVIRQVVFQDLEELAVSGWMPSAFEIDVQARLGVEWHEPLCGLTIRGRMDRVDCDPKRNRLRVIDYKFKRGGSPAASDRDLVRAVLRGERLQPVFYSLLGNQLANLKNLNLVKPEIETAFYYIAPRWTDGPLVRALFTSEALAGELGREVKHSVSFIVNGIQQGRFFIQPGDHCRYCEVSEICRKNHPPSLWRTENDPITRPHRELHQKTPKKS